MIILRRPFWCEGKFLSHHRPFRFYLTILHSRQRRNPFLSSLVWWRVERTSCALTCEEATHQKDSRERLSNRMLSFSYSQQDEGKKKVIWALKAFVAHLSGLYQALREESHLTSRYLMIVNVCDDRVMGGVMFTFFSLSIVNEGAKTWPKKGERWSDGDVKVRNLMILLEIGWALNWLMVWVWFSWGLKKFKVW